jgi:hypothetical protein
MPEPNVPKRVYKENEIVAVVSEREIAELQKCNHKEANMDDMFKRFLHTMMNEQETLRQMRQQWWQGIGRVYKLEPDPKVEFSLNPQTREIRVVFKKAEAK